jgi:hypothetical protein
MKIVKPMSNPTGDALMMTPQDFTCVECGRFICRIVPVDTNNLCAECIWVPGWFRDPELAKIVDPDHDRNPPAHEVRA